WPAQAPGSRCAALRGRASTSAYWPAAGRNLPRALPTSFRLFLISPELGPGCRAATSSCRSTALVVGSALAPYVARPQPRMLRPFGVSRAPAAIQPWVGRSITDVPLILSIVTGESRPARIALLSAAMMASIVGWLMAPGGVSSAMLGASKAV